MWLQPETEFDRRLRARIEPARRQLAEARERGESGPPQAGPLVEARRQHFMEVLGTDNDRYQALLKALSEWGRARRDSA